MSIHSVTATATAGLILAATATTATAAMRADGEDQFPGHVLASSSTAPGGVRGWEPGNATLILTWEQDVVGVDSSTVTLLDDQGVRQPVAVSYSRNTDIAAVTTMGGLPKGGYTLAVHPGITLAGGEAVPGTQFDFRVIDPVEIVSTSPAAGTVLHAGKAQDFTVRFNKAVTNVDRNVVVRDYLGYEVPVSRSWDGTSNTLTLRATSLPYKGVTLEVRGASKGVLGDGGQTWLNRSVTSVIYDTATASSQVPGPTTPPSATPTSTSTAPPSATPTPSAPPTSTANPTPTATPTSTPTPSAPPAVDSRRPWLAGRTPGFGQVVAWRNKRVRVYFNEPVTMTSSGVRVWINGKRYGVRVYPVTGRGGKVWVAAPWAPYPAGSKVHVEIGGDAFAYRVQDSAGNRASGRGWDFTIRR